MIEEKVNPPIEPLKFYLRGLAIPGIIILACAAIGAVISLLSGDLSPTKIWGAARMGAIIGFFISIAGVFEMIGGLLFAERRFMNGFYLALGYLSVWLVVAYTIGFFENNDASYLDRLESVMEE